MTSPIPRYREHRPSPALRPVVECYWTTRGEHPPGVSHLHRVLPDGCMDVIFDLAAGRADIIGTMTGALQVRQSGSVDLLGVRFRPGAAPSLVGLPADRCVDDRADLVEGWGRGGSELLDRLGTTDVPAKRFELLDRELSSRVASSPPDRLVLAAARRMDDVHPPSVTEVAGRMGVTRRTLERRFRTAVGLPPWRLARVARFRRAVGLLLAGPADLSRAALAAGYHDQPHMSRDFREMAGLPPGAWLAERGVGGGVANIQDTGRATS